MDRGADNNDKTGPGTDGNNGCGNEPRLAAPRDGGRPTDDDNNGWCGSKPTPQHKAQVARVAVKDVARPVTAKVAAPGRIQNVVTPAAPAVAAPVTTKAAATGVATIVANGTVTPLVAAPVAKAVRGAGFIGPVAGTGVAAASAAAPAALPFTGAPVGLLLMVSGLLLALGALAALAGTRRTA
jgi:hypothetical protein